MFLGCGKHQHHGSQHFFSSPNPLLQLDLSLIHYPKLLSVWMKLGLVAFSSSFFYPKTLLYLYLMFLEMLASQGMYNVCSLVLLGMMSSQQRFLWGKVVGHRKVMQSSTISQMTFLNLATLTVELWDHVSRRLPFLGHFENFAKIPYSFLWKETTHLA